MPYLRRNANGHITGLLDQPDQPDAEEVSLADPEVQAFLLDSIHSSSEDSDQQTTHDNHLSMLQLLQSLQGRMLTLERSDLEFIRVLEDLIDLLVAKDLLLFSELPQAAQGKLIDRRRLRDEQRDPSLIIEGGQIL